MADLTRSIEPLPQGTDIDFFSASSYGYRGTSSGTVALTLGTKLRVDGRAVLVVGRHILPVTYTADFSQIMPVG
jgi:hypoxanthine-guanine phosphoribosyltransferase